jgi:hypothetical protein
LLAASHRSAGDRDLTADVTGRHRLKTMTVAVPSATSADFHLAPICFYVALTPDAGEVFGVKGFTPWWERMQALPSYESTAPQLG